MTGSMEGHAPNPVRMHLEVRRTMSGSFSNLTINGVDGTQAHPGHFERIIE